MAGEGEGECLPGLIELDNGAKGLTEFIPPPEAIAAPYLGPVNPALEANRAGLRALTAKIGMAA